MPNSEGTGEKNSANVAVDQSPAAPVPPVKPETGKPLDCCPSSLEFSKEEKLSAQCPVGDAS